MIERIVPELRDALVGLFFRQVYRSSENEFVLAFEGDRFRLLLIGLDPREPRVYLIKRRSKELKKRSGNPSKFAVDIERSLGDTHVEELLKIPGERVVELCFKTNDETWFLIIQLTGKSSNLFLLDTNRSIAAAARKPQTDGHSIGAVYALPPRIKSSGTTIDTTPIERVSGSETLSEQLDEYFESLKNHDEFASLANTALRKKKSEIAKLRRLVRNLEADLAAHGDPNKWKKYGDLLLANQAGAVRNGDVVLVRDLFDPSAPMIEIEAELNESIAEAAQKYFRMYTKARNASTEITERIKSAKIRIDAAEKEKLEVEAAVESGNVGFLESFIGKQKTPAADTNRRSQQRLPSGIRSYVSSDGFTILVGKKASDNDVLTFKVAHSRDIWMHAADYPGSHVVIRNANRKEIPPRTMIEAAQLAAFYSQGKKQPKAAVNYTEKKFVNKPKGVAAGLVRLASFKTILVEPVFPSITPN